MLYPHILGEKGTNKYYLSLIFHFIVTKSDFETPIATTYTAGGPTILYYSNTDAGIADSTIRWTPDTILLNEDRMYTPEFGNPVSLNEVFNSVGSGDFRLTCFYRMSPTNVLGIVNLDIRGMVNAVQ